MAYQWKNAPALKVVDPVAHYRLVTMAPHHPIREDGVWWSALLTLVDMSIEEFLTLVTTLYPDRIFVSKDYFPVEQETKTRNPSLVVIGETSVLSAINQEENGISLSRFVLGSIETRPSTTAKAQPAEPDLSPISCPGGSVAMAVIDGGIAFGHDLFRSDPTETRVESFQIMALPELTSSQGYFEWRTLGKKRIDRLLADHTEAGLLDDEAFYQEAGLIDHADGTIAGAMYRTSHGTHVMALAAGYESEAAPTTRPILACQLPSDVTEDVTGATLEPYVAAAVQHIRRQAGRFRVEGDPNFRPPLAINFSYGNFEGPHDGTSLISTLIAEAENPLREGLPEQTTRFVLPAGNGNLSRTHAELIFTRRKKKERIPLYFRTQPDDRTASVMRMWMPYVEGEAPNFISVTVSTPQGIVSKPLNAVNGARQQLLNDAGAVVAELSYHFQPAPTSRGVVTLFVNPNATDRMDGLSPFGKPLSPSGLWMIEAVPEEITPHQKVEAWISRGETLPGFPPAGRQAFFDNPDYVTFNEFGGPLAVDPEGSTCPVRRAGTLSGFACGVEPIVVGGFTESNRLMSDYSAAGPVTPTRGAPEPGRMGPDASTISDDSPALSGVISAGSASGSMVRQNGTSVAAPILARYIANALEQHRPATRTWVQEQAAISDRELSPPRPPKPSVERTGGGRLDTGFRFGPRVRCQKAP